MRRSTIEKLNTFYSLSVSLLWLVFIPIVRIQEQFFHTNYIRDESRPAHGFERAEGHQLSQCGSLRKPHQQSASRVYSTNYGADCIWNSTAAAWTEHCVFNSYLFARRRPSNARSLLGVTAAQSVAAQAYVCCWFRAPVDESQRAAPTRSTPWGWVRLWARDSRRCAYLL